MKEVHSQLVDVVLLTHEDGSTMLCRGGESAVRKFWDLWPIVKAEFTGEKQLLQTIDADEIDQPYIPSSHM
jgi:1,4-dihydroxy-2-naphthoyl-CoA synthase